MRNSKASATFFVLLLPACVADAQVVQQYTAPLFDKPPLVDGQFSPSEWERAVGFDGMKAEGVLEERSVRAFVGATETDIHVAVVSELPENGQLLGKINADIPKTVYDDTVEVVMDPSPSAGKGKTFRLIASVSGACSCLARSSDGTTACPEINARCVVQHGFSPDHWIVELRIPLDSIAPGRGATDGQWGINVCRNWKQPWKSSSIAPRNDNSCSSIFRFKKDSLVATFENETDLYEREFGCGLKIKNVSPTPASLTASISVKRNTMPEMIERRDLSIAAGAEEILEFRHKETNSDGFRLAVDVETPAGEKIYSQHYKWGRPRSRRWTHQKKNIMPLDFKFSYYPYLGKMRVLADISGLKEEAQLEALEFTIRGNDSNKPARKVTLTHFPEKRIERIFEIPELVGEYEIAMEAKGENVPSEPLVKEFIRARWPWDQSELGTSDKVYPPFTPIALEGMKVAMVLKDYTLNRMGLVDQVTAGGRGLLAAPIRFTAKVGGQNRAFDVRSFEITEKEDHVLKTQSSFLAGALGGAAEATWEYDGMLTYNLLLEPTDGVTVDQLVLEIPLKNKYASMIHAMTEGIRAPCISETLPDGEGVIWTADELANFDMPQGFCTYIFLGGPNRGLSWFADNDFGWDWDRDTPNVELVRDGGVLTLNVNLINKSLVIEKKRRIRFGILAAPVKPRLPGWRHKWWTDRYTLLGTNINWLSAPGHASEVYPPGKDLYFWEILAKGNRERLPAEAVEEVARRGMPYFRPWGEAEVERWVRHVKHNLRSRLGKKMVFYYNRAVNNTNPEYATFMNEWELNDYPPRDFTPALDEIKYVPSASLIDFSLHWYAKSFEYRNRGVYWDNWFIKPSFNRVMTDAYLDATGNVVPAAGIWELRELARRTFVMMNEKGMLPITMPHMTSTNILPMHSFATVQYDWEWKYSNGDVQDRFTREYLQLVSNGGLAGTWPVLLNDHGELADDAWTQRTFAGVSLVHELIGDGHGEVWKTLRDPLLSLMKDPKLNVYRYWDEQDQPFSAQESDLPAIVYSIPGKVTMAVLCSYAEKDVQACIRIDPDRLGYKGDYEVVNYETGERFEVKNDQFTVPVKRHEVIGVKITPKLNKMSGYPGGILAPLVLAAVATPSAHARARDDEEKQNAPSRKTSTKSSSNRSQQKTESSGSDEHSQYVDRQPYESLSEYLAIPPFMEERMVYFNTFSHPDAAPEINAIDARTGAAGAVVADGYFGRGLLLQGNQRFRIESPALSPHRPITVIAWWKLGAPLEERNQGGGILALRSRGGGYISTFARGGPWCGLQDTHLVLQIYNFPGIQNINGVLEGGFRQRYATTPLRWHNTVLTVNTASRVSLHVDGQLKKRYSLSGRTLNADDEIHHLEFGSFGMGLHLDEITVLDAALKDDDVEAYFEALSDIRRAW